MSTISRTELTKEIIDSKKQGQLTPRGLSLISKLIAHYASKDFDNSHDMSYSILYAADKIMMNENWRGFNPEVSDDAFPYMVQIIRGYFAGYKMSLRR